jgi:hypothetical protein
MSLLTSKLDRIGGSKAPPALGGVFVFVDGGVFFE